MNHPLSIYSNKNHSTVWGYAFLGACLWAIFKSKSTIVIQNPRKEIKLIKQEGAERIAANSDWYVYKIKTHEACMIYGANTKWCITQKGGNYWRRYSRKSQFYFIMSKKKRNDDWNKIAVQVERDGKISYFDEKDTRHDSLPVFLGVPEFEKKPKEASQSQGTLTAEEINDEYSNEIEKIVEDEIQARVASFFDEDNYDNVTEGVDIRLPYHFAEYYEHKSIKDGNIEGKSTKALREIMEMFPAVDEYVRDPSNAYLSWSNSSGMMPYGDANYPEDAVILYIGGIDSEEESSIRTEDLMEMLGIEEENENAFEEFIDEYGDRYGLKKSNFEDIYLYGRHQTVHAIYMKSGEIKELVKQILSEGEFEQEFIDQASELVEVMTEKAGDFR